MGFPINPPNAPLVDAQGKVTREWYRFFLEIQKMIGGPSNPFEDTWLMGSPSRAQADALAADAALSLAPPVVPFQPADDLAPAGFTVPASLVSGQAALTKADDTNVTVTIGGTPARSLLTDVSLTMGWTGTLAVARGGTGGGTASGTLLDNITAFAGTGLIARTGAGSYAFRTLTGPAAGITVSNGDGVAGNPTLALANDLAAVEGLGTAGMAARTGADAWATRVLTGTADRITVTNGDGVAGAPTFNIATSYVGQASITTLGTITTGVWNGSTVPVANGGTGTTTSTGTGSVVLSASPTLTGTLTAATVTASGTVSSVGFRDSGTVLARFEGTGGSVPSGSTGVGEEIYHSDGIVRLQAYNRSTSAFAPVDLIGSYVRLRPGDALPADYADDVAAAAGGIPVGAIYRTASVVKVRVA